MIFRFFLIYNNSFTEIDEPIGFDNFKPKLKRDPQAHGITWEFTEQGLGFYAQAANIIHQAYHTDIDSEVEFLVEYQCNGVDWKEFYRGLLDFMTYNEEISNTCIVNVSINQLGVQMAFKNRFDNKVNLDSLQGFDGAVLKPYSNLGKTITLPPKTIKAEAKATKSISQPINFSNNGTTFFNVPFTKVEGEFYEILNVDTVHNYFNVNDIPPIVTISSTGPQPLGATSIKIKLYVIMDIIQNFGKPSLTVYLMKNNEQIKDWEGTITNLPYGKAKITVVVDYKNDSINLQGGDALYLYTQAYWDVDGNKTLAYINSQGDNYINIIGNSQYAFTNTKHYLLHETLSRATEIVTDGQLTVKSDYYGRHDSEINPTKVDGCGSLRAITRGMNVRNAVLTDGKRPLTEISLKQLLLNDLKAIDNIGFGVEDNVLRVEPYEYFYKNDVVLTCTNIDKIIREVVHNKCLQLLNIGYAKWEAEEYNGIDGFHGKRQYRTKLKTNNAKIEMYCKLIADGYAIEATRRRQIENTSKDWRYDDDMFIFDLRRNNGLEVNIGVTGTDGTLIDETTIYNARLSPARMAMRWYGWMMQVFNSQDKLYYNGGEGYTNAKMLSEGNCIRENYTISENQDITTNDMKNIPLTLFNAETVTFNYPLSVTDFEKLRANPQGLIQFENEYGWIQEVVCDIAVGIAEFTLIVKK